MLVGSNSRNPKPHAQDQLTLFSRYRFGFEKDIIWPPKISPLSYSDTFVFHSWFLGAFTSWQRNPFKFWVNNTIKKTWRIHLIYGFFFSKKKTYQRVCCYSINRGFPDRIPGTFHSPRKYSNTFTFPHANKNNWETFFFLEKPESQ